MHRADIVSIVKRNADSLATATFGHWAFDDQQLTALITDVVKECSRVAKLHTGSNAVCDVIEHHFGLEE